MTPFFLPGASPGIERDRAYSPVREQTEILIGEPVRAMRIYAVDARREGSRL